MHICITAPSYPSFIPFNIQTIPVPPKDTWVTQAALTLSKRGHQVTFVSPLPPFEEEKIKGINQNDSSWLDTSYDLIMVFSQVGIIFELSQKLPQTPLVLLIAESPEAPSMDLLGHPEIQAALSGIVFISPQQHKEFSLKYALPSSLCHLLKLAVSSDYNTLFERSEVLMSRKSKTPALLSFSFKDTEHWLLESFARMRSKSPLLQWFILASAADFEDLKSLEKYAGVIVLPPIPAPQLALLLSRIHVLLVPNVCFDPAPFLVAQALCAGCDLIAFESIYLSEITHNETSFIAPGKTDAFSQAIEINIQSWESAPATWAIKAFNHVYFANHHHLWLTKGWELDSLLYRILHGTAPDDPTPL